MWLTSNEILIIKRPQAGSMGSSIKAILFIDDRKSLTKLSHQAARLEVLEKFSSHGRGRGASRYEGSDIDLLTLFKYHTHTSM